MKGAAPWSAPGALMPDSRSVGNFRAPAWLVSRVPGKWPITVLTLRCSVIAVSSPSGTWVQLGDKAPAMRGPIADKTPEGRAALIDEGG